MKRFTNTFINNKGFALPLVLGIMAVLLILSFSAYSLSMNNRQILSKSLNKDVALYNAESAYNKALWQLNSIGYSFYKGIENTNPIEIIFNQEKYRAYSLPDGDNYRLEILVPLREIPSMPGEFKEDNNNLIVRATGWDPKNLNNLRTIEVEVYKRTFTQHAMVNESESYKDQNIVWASNEKMYGPLHTNDILYLSGEPEFFGLVTYTNGISPQTAISNKNIFKAGVKETSRITIKPANPELKAHAITNGHYYNGRTCIYLVEGGYNVRTYDSKNNKWKYNDIEYRSLTNPVRPSTDNNWLDDELEKEAANNGLIMFQRVIRNSDGTVNESKTNLPENSFSSFDELRSKIEHKVLPFPVNRVIYVDGLYIDEDATAIESIDQGISNKMSLAYGNIFVAGRLDGQLTIAAANDIYITGHDPCDWAKPFTKETEWFATKAGVSYLETDFIQKFNNGVWEKTEVTGNGEDMLGLVANRKVHILHYKWPSNISDYYWDIEDELAPNDIYIYGALYSGTHSFGFEAHKKGNKKNEIKLVGSITQAFRGPVGMVNSSGYNKNYTHDPRMLLDAPPFYPLPEDIGWLSSRWNETDDHILPKD